MYIPKQFEEPRIDLLHQHIQAHPLATLVTHSSRGLNANHIPLHFLGSPEPYGTLRGHVARANPLLSDVTNETESLAIFHGPNCYVTPSWYATKKEHGKVVPTWNFSVVHAYGILRVIDDPTWLRAQLEALTDRHESAFPEPWALSDAPPEYLEKIMAGIIGIEMVIARLEGKWKVSQNQPPQNQASIIAGLKASSSPETLAMVSLVEANKSDAS